MREPILMPTLSDTMETGHLLKWLKQPGERVVKGDALAEIESDKAVMEVEAFSSGYLNGPLASEDSEIPVGSVIGYLVDKQSLAGAEKSVNNDTAAKTKTEVPYSDDSIAESAARKDTKNNTKNNTENETNAINQTGSSQAPMTVRKTAYAKSVTPTHITNDAQSSNPASPYARGLAQELDINLAQVTAGPDGVIRASHVMEALLAGGRAKLDEGPEYTLQAMTPMQRAIARNMTATIFTPTFRVSARLSLQALRVMAQQRAMSLTLLLARACALTVSELPRFNALYTVNGLAQRQQVDIGIAVDVPNGLITPVLRDAAQQPLEKLSEEWQQLKKKAEGKIHSHRLTPEDYRGATFYLSNLGMFRQVNHFDAIVPPGAAAILSLGSEQSDGTVEFTLSCDHRVVYGADAARFLEILDGFLSRLHWIPGEATK